MPETMVTSAFHAMAKPAGADCNLQCVYCFYLEKAAFQPGKQHHRMSDAVLECYVKSYIASIPDEAEVAFTWQGGEPTLAGLKFFRQAVELQKRYGAGRCVTNSFQTNGLLINDEWCAFFKEHDFLIGLSLDGPAFIHDEYRATAGGIPTHRLVMRALALLRHHGVRHNILAVVNRFSSRMPLRVYEFLRESGAEYIQFLPVVERFPGAAEVEMGLRLHGPGCDLSNGDPPKMTDWSVQPGEYGRFLTNIFDVWVKRDVGKIFVMNFEWALANFMGRPGTVCHHQPACGRSVIVEYDGDVYPCDHYVYPGYRLGNILENSFASMLDSPGQIRFGTDKSATLTSQCRQCAMLGGCWGGCPKHRFVSSNDGEPGHNYLCEGLNHYFRHLSPYLRVLATLIANGHPANAIMGMRPIRKSEL